MMSDNTTTQSEAGTIRDGVDRRFVGGAVWELWDKTLWRIVYVAAENSFIFVSLDDSGVGAADHTVAAPEGSDGWFTAEEIRAFLAPYRYVGNSGDLRRAQDEKLWEQAYAEALKERFLFGGGFMVKPDGKLYPKAPPGKFVDEKGEEFEPAPVAGAVNVIASVVGGSGGGGGAITIVKRGTAASDG